MTYKLYYLKNRRARKPLRHVFHAPGDLEACRVAERYVAAKNAFLLNLFSGGRALRTCIIHVGNTAMRRSA